MICSSAVIIFIGCLFFNIFSSFFSVKILTPTIVVTSFVIMSKRRMVVSSFQSGFSYTVTLTLYNGIKKEQNAMMSVGVRGDSERMRILVGATPVQWNRWRFRLSRIRWSGQTQLSIVQLRNHEWGKLFIARTSRDPHGPIRILFLVRWPD